MIVIHLASILKITNPSPFSYTGKRGLVSGYELFVTAETEPNEPGGESTGLAKVQFRAPTPEALIDKVSALNLKKGEPAQIKLKLFDVGQNEMYSVNAA